MSSGRLAEETAEIYPVAVAAFGVTLDVPPEKASVLSFARAHTLTVYNGLYLELALRHTASR